MLIFSNDLLINLLIGELFEKALYDSKNGFFEEALEDWNQFLELFPEEPLAWSNRGNVRFALRDFEGAIADQTKSIEMFSFFELENII